MMFSMRVIHKKLLSKPEFCVGSVTVALYLRVQVNFYLYFLYFLMDWVKSDIQDVHIMPLSS